MPTDHISDASAPITWRKSTYSSGANDACVEVSDDRSRALTLVRDSKNPAGPVLLFAGGAWGGFIRSMRAER